FLSSTSGPFARGKRTCNRELTAAEVLGTATFFRPFAMQLGSLGVQGKRKLRALSSGTKVAPVTPSRSFIASKAPKKNVLSWRIGPPSVPPNSLRLKDG